MRECGAAARDQRARPSGAAQACGTLRRNPVESCMSTPHARKRPGHLFSLNHALCGAVTRPKLRVSHWAHAAVSMDVGGETRFPGSVRSPGAECVVLADPQPEKPPGASLPVHNVRRHV